MNINDRAKKPQTQDPLEALRECTDGFIVVGYTKDSHDKFAQFYASDNACNDALAFFHAHVHNWMNLMKANPDKEEEDDS